MVQSPVFSVETTSPNYPPGHQLMTPHPSYSLIMFRAIRMIIRVKLKDDTILDVVDIMSQTYVNIDEGEIEEDIILDVVDIISL